MSIDRDLGSMGQDYFSFLCAKANITANPSKIDSWGWDFYLEFPQEMHENISLDMRASPIKCKVQVKATGKEDKSVQIEISNLEKLVKSPEPVFFCFIGFDKESKAQSAYLVHLGKELIGKILKKIRELQYKKGDVQLNKHKMSINYRLPDFNVASLDGIEISQKIKEYIPDGIDKYIENKRIWRDEVGFENGHGQITFTIDQNNKEKLMDAAVGINSEITVNSFEHYTSRFNILDKGEKILSGGKIILTPSHINGYLIFKEHLFSSGIKFDANLYTCKFPNIEQQFRIKSTFFEVRTCEGNNLRVDLSFDHDTKYKLKDFQDFMNIMTILMKLSSDSKPINIDFALKDKSLKEIKDISIFEMSRESVDSIRMDMKKYYWHEITSILKRAHTIATHYNISSESIYLNFRELCESAKDIILLDKYIQNRLKGIQVNIPPIVGDSDENENRPFVVCVRAKIGNYMFGEFMTITDNKLSSGQDLITISEGIYHDQYQFCLSEDDEQACHLINFIYEILDKIQLDLKLQNSVKGILTLNELQYFCKSKNH
jgi:hypothetical protein